MIQGEATARYVRTSAQKAGLVLDLIRGCQVNKALALLQYSRKHVARDVDRLVVSACYADQGPSMKRVRPAPMGRAFRVVKRTAHLTVQVTEKAAPIVTTAAPAPKAPRRRAAKSQAAEKAAKAAK